MFLVTIFCFLAAGIEWCANISALAIVIRTVLVNASADISLSETIANALAQVQPVNLVMTGVELLVVRSVSHLRILRSHSVMF